MAFQILQKHAGPFAYELPYWSVEEGVLVHMDGSFSKGFLLSGLDTWCLSDSKLAEIFSDFKGLFNTFPKDIQFELHLIQDDKAEKEVLDFTSKIGAQSGMREYLLKDRLTVLSSSLSYRFRLYLFIAKRLRRQGLGPAQKIAAYFKTLLFGQADGDEFLKARQADAVSELDRVYRDIKNRFGQESFAFQIRPMEKEEYEELLSESLNPNKYRARLI